MTKNEFKLCCSLFGKYYKGRTLKEILKKECFVYYKIDECVFNDTGINTVRFGNYGKNVITNKLEFQCILYYLRKSLCFNGFDVPEEYSFKRMKDFLNYFKIPLEDIV